MGNLLSPHEFEQIVRLTPLVSIDLIVRTKAGKVLFGWRTNEPAKGCWFVPGGRILKGETRAQAFQRITKGELGIRYDLTDASFVGVYDHIYSTNAGARPTDFGTHYLVIAFELIVPEEMEHLPKEQHAKYKWFSPGEALNDPDVHENCKVYFRRNANET